MARLVMAQTIRKAVEAAYRTDLLDPRRKMMQDWEVHVLSKRPFHHNSVSDSFASPDGL